MSMNYENQEKFYTRCLMSYFPTFVAYIFRLLRELWVDLFIFDFKFWFVIGIVPAFSFHVSIFLTDVAIWNSCFKGLRSFSTYLSVFILLSLDVDEAVNWSSIVAWPLLLSLTSASTKEKNWARSIGFLTSCWRSHYRFPTPWTSWKSDCLKR